MLLSEAVERTIWLRDKLTNPKDRDALALLCNTADAHERLLLNFPDPADEAKDRRDRDQERWEDQCS